MPTPTRAEASGGARNFQKRLFSDLARTEQTAKERLARHDAATTRCVVADWIRRESIRRELFTRDFRAACRQQPAPGVRRPPAPPSPAGAAKATPQPQSSPNLPESECAALAFDREPPKLGGFSKKRGGVPVSVSPLSRDAIAGGGVGLPGCLSPGATTSSAVVKKSVGGGVPSFSRGPSGTVGSAGSSEYGDQGSDGEGGSAWRSPQGGVSNQASERRREKKGSHSVVFSPVRSVVTIGTTTDSSPALGPPRYRHRSATVAPVSTAPSSLFGSPVASPRPSAAAARGPSPHIGSVFDVRPLASCLRASGKPPAEGGCSSPAAPPRLPNTETPQTSPSGGGAGGMDDARQRVKDRKDELEREKARRLEGLQERWEGKIFKADLKKAAVEARAQAARDCQASYGRVKVMVDCEQGAKVKEKDCGEELAAAHLFALVEKQKALARAEAQRQRFDAEAAKREREALEARRRQREEEQVRQRQRAEDKKRTLDLAKLRGSFRRVAATSAHLRSATCGAAPSFNRPAPWAPAAAVPRISPSAYSHLLGPSSDCLAVMQKAGQRSLSFAPKAAADPVKDNPELQLRLLASPLLRSPVPQLQKSPARGSVPFRL
ncbi:hypothetical protein DIPPA_25144 [Diplonema papillatum]|nr:hypothetical protein DIPPA_25144 [Diplonema papillatum]